MLRILLQHLIVFLVFYKDVKVSFYCVYIQEKRFMFVCFVSNALSLSFMYHYFSILKYFTKLTNLWFVQ